MSKLCLNNAYLENFRMDRGSLHNINRYISTENALHLGFHLPEIQKLLKRCTGYPYTIYTSLCTIIIYHMHIHIVVDRTPTCLILRKAVWGCHSKSASSIHHMRISKSPEYQWVGYTPKKERRIIRIKTQLQPESNIILGVVCIHPFISLLHYHSFQDRLLSLLKIVRSAISGKSNAWT